MSERPSAIVTGGSRGIGRAVVVRLAKDGFDVAFCSRSAGADVAETLRLARLSGANCIHQVCDVSDAQAVRAFTRQAEEEHGPPSAMVSAAGVVRDGPMFRMPIEDWNAVVDTNLTGSYNICRSVIFGMMRRGVGSVVNISSVVGIHGNVAQANYAASKGGVNGMTKALAKEVAGHGVRVNAVAPGFIETDMTAGLTGKVRAKAIESIPVRRFGTPGSVADLVSFLVSDQAEYIVGQVIQVDGGIAL
ncbi:3-oxoacyl-ACP reductase FabG [Amycolatopsis sp. NPDC049868]|uniref:3-oxoacyl-ACP reductase FabG n=1 Tax=Amycolatopsis sp. NPDC049868 TaxID=3363934 RepID=UPI0037AA2DAE